MISPSLFAKIKFFCYNNYYEKKEEQKNFIETKGYFQRAIFCYFLRVKSSIQVVLLYVLNIPGFLCRKKLVSKT